MGEYDLNPFAQRTFHFYNRTSEYLKRRNFRDGLHRDTIPFIRLGCTKKFSTINFAMCPELLDVTC